MFGVEWRPSVQLVLIELWGLADPPLQARISAAVNMLEQRLSRDPLNEGESRDGDIRMTFESPLGISFVVDTDAKTVTVIKVWQYA